MTRVDRAEQILEHAQRMVQVRGFNAFSYADLAEATGIRKASIHYHFKTKAQLGLELLERYTRGLIGALTQLDTLPSASTRLEGFIDAYRQTQVSGAICLCGSMASDAETLDDATREVIGRYVRLSSEWVEKTLAKGVEDGEFAPGRSTQDAAASLVSALQGALVMSRATGDFGSLDAVERRFFESFRG